MEREIAGFAAMVAAGRLTMTPESGIGLLIIKVCGAAIGAALAQIYLLPKTRREFMLRSTFSVPVGVLFSWVPMRMIDFPEGIEGTIAASCLAAFAAWWAAGAVVRIAETFNGKKP